MSKSNNAEADRIDEGDSVEGMVEIKERTNV